MKKNTENIKLEETLKNYKNYILSIALSYLKIHDDAQEALQKVMIKLFESSKKFNPEKGKLSSWIGFITKNTCIDMLRKKQRSKETDLEASGSMNISCESESIEEKMDRAELLIMLKKAMQKLCKTKRQIIELRFFKNMSHKEIAEIMQMNVCRIGSEIQRAVNALRKVSMVELHEYARY